MRFHFQVRTETHIMLSETADFGDLNEARVEAAKRVGILLHDHAGKIWADELWQMDVTDEAGLTLFSLYVQALRAAASPR